MRIIILSILILLSIYAFICVLLYCIQHRMIFSPEKLPDDYVFHFGQPFKELYFQTMPDVRINALLFEAENSKGVVLYFHGNAAALDNWGYVAKDFVDRGYDVCIPDYRAFGKSTGKLSESGLHYDAMFIYNSLTKTYKKNNIILYGRSLGTGIAVRLASLERVKKLGLETPFLSILSISKQRMPLLPVGLLHRFPFRSDQYIKDVNCPILMIHGTDDRVIPLESCKALHRLSGPDAELIVVSGAAHNNISEFEAYDTFLDELLSD